MIKMIGEQYNDWLVIEQAAHRGRMKYWLCECNCGIRAEVQMASLRNGASKRCRVCGNQAPQKYSYGSQEGFGKVVRGVLSRCQPNAARAERYFSRGITVCKDWRLHPLDFRIYLEQLWLKQIGTNSMDRYGSELTLDRKNNSKGYEPGNLKFSTYAEQAQNRG